MASNSVYADQKPSKQQSNVEDNEQESRSNIGQKYERIIASLPQCKGPGKDCYFLYEGFWYEQIFGVGVLWAKENFRARSSDVLLASFPKCGTTWLKALTFAIMNRNQYDISTHPLLTTNPHKCVGYIETYVHHDDPISYLNSLPSPRLLSTHIAFTSLPKSFIDLGPKIVCVSRNPKDVLVSLWIFVINHVRAKELPPLSLQEAFEFFCQGIGLAGPFWDYVLGYWKASLESPDTVLFLKYEDMKSDTLLYVKKLAKFLGRPFTLEEDRRGVAGEIIKLCSFENLSKLEENISGTYSLGSRTRAKIENKAFFRRGEVGDSKNYLTREMIEKLDLITKQKLAGSGLEL